MDSILHLCLLSLLPLISSSSHQRHLLQSSSPNQNIETFFPSIPSPAFVGQTPPPPPPPQPPFSRLPTPTSNSSDRGKVTKAVIATAASTFALSFLIFFIFHRFSLKKHRRRAKVFDSQRSSINQPAGGKGMIVDENGLDVLYWRNLVGGDDTPKRCNRCNCILDQKSFGPSQLSVVSDEKYDRKGQELPLLPSNSISSSEHTSKSSSSRITSIAPPASPAPPPPPPPKAPPPPPPMPKKNIAPPPPMPPMPPRPPSKNSAATAQSLPHGGGSGSSRPPLMPPPPPQAEGGRSRAKLKPLHWDKVTPHNPEHSMVWDKISDGSFRSVIDLKSLLPLVSRDVDKCFTV